MLEEFANLSPVKKQENYKNPTFVPMETITYKKLFKTIYAPVLNTIRNHYSFSADIKNTIFRAKNASARMKRVLLQKEYL